MNLVKKDAGREQELYIMLIDRWCKNTIRASISNSMRSRIIFINDFVEITEEILSRSRTLFVLESFMNNHTAVAFLSLYKKLMGLDIIYLGCDRALFSKVSPICRVYPCDVTGLSMELLVSAAYDDESMKSKDCTDNYYEESRAFAKSLVDSSSSDEIRKLACDFLSLEDERESHLSKRIKLASDLSDALTDNSRLLEENRKLAEGYKNILADSYSLNHALRDYEGILSKEMYKKINLSEYQDRPLILYFKEFEELLGFDMFISTLYEIFRMQNKNSVKVLMLFDSYTAMRMRVLPDYFTTLYNSYNTRQVILCDFLAKSGDASGVLDQLLRNKENLNVLLIFDCKSLPDTVLSGQYLQFNICRDCRHLAAYDLVDENTIVNGHGGVNYLEFDHAQYERELPNFVNQTEKFLYLSSQQIYQNILTLTKLYKDRM